MLTSSDFVQHRPQKAPLMSIHRNNHNKSNKINSGTPNVSSPKQLWEFIWNSNDSSAASGFKGVAEVQAKKKRRDFHEVTQKEYAIYG